MSCEFILHTQLFHSLCETVLSLFLGLCRSSEDQYNSQILPSNLSSIPIKSSNPHFWEGNSFLDTYPVPPSTPKRRRDAPFILLTIFWAEPTNLAMPFEAWHSIQILQDRAKKATNSPVTLSQHTERTSTMPLRACSPMCSHM